MAFLGLVVEWGALLDEPRELGGVEQPLGRKAGDLLDEVEQKAAVAIGHRAQRGARIRGQRQLAAECRLGAAEQRFEIVVAEPAQHQHLGARQQRADQLEGRVLGRGPDEDNGAVLDDRQEGVLLGAVEAVDLVDKEQGAAADLAALARRLEHLAQVGDAGKHSRQRLEFEIGAVRQQACDRGLAAAGRPPQDHRGELPARDHSSDRAIRAEQMILPHDLAEALRPQAVGERPRRLVFEKGGHRCVLCGE